MHLLDKHLYVVDCIFSSLLASCLICLLTSYKRFPIVNAWIIGKNNHSFLSTDKVRLLDIVKTCLQKRIGLTCKENER